MKQIKKIASFTVNHDTLTEGIYISRIDGDVTTYDMRTRVPNAGDYMDNLTMHSFEHMFATLVRSSAIGERVIYFGPMGCQTGFYLLVRGEDHTAVLSTVLCVLREIITYDGEMFGYYINLYDTWSSYRPEEAGVAVCYASIYGNTEKAARYLAVLEGKNNDFKYND